MRTDNLASFLSVLFEEQNVSPGGCTKVAGIVIRISSPRETIVRHMVPFLASNLTRFAPDASGGWVEETVLDFFLQVIVPPLICVVSSFADHRLSFFPSKP